MASFKIVMNFKNDVGKNVTMTVADAKPTVTQAEAVAAMDAILAADIFRPDNIALSSKLDCKLVETTVSDFYDVP
jgi:Protein of unknown function (DUF2922).